MRAALAAFFAVFFACASGAEDAAPPAAAKQKQILIVLTSHAELFGTGRKTGFWFEELAVPYYVFRKAGYGVVIASIRGGRTEPDPASLKEPSAAVKRFQQDEAAMKLLRRSVPLNRIDPARFDAVLVAGGRGALWDLVSDVPLTDLLQRYVLEGKPIGTLSHGAVALLEMKGRDGRHFLHGRRVAVATKREEEAAGLVGVVPSYADAQMQENGARVERAAPGQANAVRDGLLITGQNAASAERVAKLLVEAMR